MQEPKVRIKSSFETDGALVITCFPSVGMVTSVVGHYLIEHLNLDYIGGVFDSRLPAVALIQDGAPMPPVRAYAGRPECNLEGCEQVILLMSEIILKEPIVNEISWALMEWSKEQNLVGGVIVDSFAKAGMKGGLDGSEPVVEYEDTENIDVLGIGTTKNSRSRLEELDIPLLSQGVIKGMNASLLGEARRRGLDVMGIMAEADPRYPDARAAAEIIKKLDKILEMSELDHKPLIEEAEFLESQLRGMIEIAQEETKTKGSSASNSMLYG